MQEQYLKLDILNTTLHRGPKLILALSWLKDVSVMS